MASPEGSSSIPHWGPSRPSGALHVPGAARLQPPRCPLMSERPAAWHSDFIDHGHDLDGHLTSQMDQIPSTRLPLPASPLHRVHLIL